MESAVVQSTKHTCRYLDPGCAPKKIWHAVAREAQTDDEHNLREW